jgi:FkbM family methyltransferase
MLNSQHGEEKIVTSILGDISNGTVVDIGAADGVRFSNSKYFIDIGWKAILIEPNPSTFNMLSKEYSHNPNVILENVACGHITEASVDFWVDHNDQHQQLSTLKADQVKKCIELYRCEFTNIKVPLVKTQDILEKYSILHIDFLSVDTEDFDENVLLGIDFKRTNVRILCVEHDTPIIQSIMLQNSFALHSKNNNTFYVKENK